MGNQQSIIQQIKTQVQQQQPQQQPPSTIKIVEASYGKNCNQLLRGNRTELFNTLANGKGSLQYQYDYTKTGGDPAGGCGKTLEIVYNCGDNVNKTLVVPPEAGINGNVNITCGGNQPPPAGAFKEQKRIELNMAKSDVVKKQTEYDNLSPEEAIKRKTDEGNREASAYISKVQTRMEYETNIYNTKFSEVETLVSSPAYQLAQKYRKDLAEKYQNTLKEHKKYKEAYVTNRRRFLDANPHESVVGYGPFKTLDDRILLLFWICYLLFIIPATYQIITGLGPIISNPTATIWGVILGACVIAHLAIRNLA